MLRSCLESECAATGYACFRSLQAPSAQQQSTTIQYDVFGQEATVHSINKTVDELAQEMKYCQVAISITPQQKQLLQATVGAKANGKPKMKYLQFQTFENRVQLTYVLLNNLGPEVVVWGLLQRQVQDAADELQNWLGDSSFTRYKLMPRVSKGTPEEWIIRKLFATQYYQHIEKTLLECTTHKMKMTVSFKGTPKACAILSGPKQHVDKAKAKL